MHADGCSDVQAWLVELLAFLQTPASSTLLSMRMIHTLSDGLFDQLPEGWADALHQLSWEGIRALARGETPTECPASLTAFVEAAGRLSLKRSCELTDAVLAAGDRVEAERLLAAAAPSPLRPPLTSWMSPKKRHEVECCSGLIAALCERLGLRRVLDVGSGEGYLDNVLAYNHGLHVTGIEMQGARTCGAQRKALVLGARLAAKAFGPLLGGGPAGGDNVTPAPAQEESLAATPAADPAAPLRPAVVRFLATRPPPVFRPLRVACAADLLAGADCDGGAVVGLHACGPLSSIILHAFVRSSAAALVCIGCCYRPLGEPPSDDTSDISYPMSTALPPRDRLPSYLSAPEVLELATHAAEQWVEASDAELRRHGNRAILELLLQRCDGAPPLPGRPAAETGALPPNLPKSNGASATSVAPHRAVSRLRLKKGHQAEEATDGASFLRYTRAVLANSVGTDDLTDADILACYAAHEHEVLPVAALYALRLVVARALES
eukprot:EG_transcript_10209